MPDASLRPLAKDDWDFWTARHLLLRAGFGGTPSQVRAVTNLGLDDAVDYIVDFESIPFDPVTENVFDANIMRPPSADERAAVRRARQSGDEAAVERFRRDRQARQRADREQIARVQMWWLKRMIETPRPLEEKMTLFWHGHFATGYRAIEDSYHMFQQNQLFRAHAVGDYADLTRSIIRDPAMLRYLNNNQNVARRPNENLARELLELFTLGEGNGYTEDDIKQAARALTGYTFNDDAFVFNRRQHDDEPKRILGQIGNWDGDDVVDIVLKQRVCSEYMCLKLYRYFVNDLPGGPDDATQQFIVKLAKEFRNAKYDLRPVLKTLFRSRHFYDPANMRAQIKSPVQLVVQAIRSLRTPVRSLSSLAGATNLMGQNLFYPPSVKGWDGGRAWINTSTMFIRQNTLVYLLTGRRPDAQPWEIDGEPYDPRSLVEHLEDDAGTLATEDVCDYLLSFCLGGTSDPTRRAALLNHAERAGASSADDPTLLVDLLSLITAMPEYQLC